MSANLAPQYEVQKRHANLAGDRRDVDESAAAARLHRLEEALCEARAREVVDGRHVLGDVKVGRRANLALAQAGIVDEDVDATKERARLLGGGRQRFEFGHVERQNGNVRLGSASATISSRRASSALVVRAERINLAPRAPSCFANSAPRPDDAPVIQTTLPL